jgi:hypothetical protein
MYKNMAERVRQLIKLEGGGEGCWQGCDRDPSFHFNTDPDPTFHFIAGPDLAQHDQSDANLRPLVYRASGPSF